MHNGKINAILQNVDKEISVYLRVRTRPQNNLSELHVVTLKACFYPKSVNSWKVTPPYKHTHKQLLRPDCLVPTSDVLSKTFAAIAPVCHQDFAKSAEV
ncbi:hypothetical protein CDAR_287001 [Caerostris darwini]|uniref:Uncharacterized protein n=1 Tax=Caerostris darwini TaxID=1538125 RepID=A0AAV4RFT4_9ARAC|nr:hypothetical protein CDAR_287001 [Caerostris darwini]